MRRKGTVARRQIAILAISFIALMVTTVVPAHAQQLMVYPTRLTFEGSVRTAQVQLFNRGTEEATYRISIIRMRMDEKGGMQKVTEPLSGEHFADELIRFSPRQVVIPPGGTQTVRVQLRKPAELAAGEYRSHMLFQALPAAAKNVKPTDDRGLQITLRPIVSISIPLIVLQGATSSTIAIEHAELHAPAKSGEKSTVSFELVRSGSRSTYGDVTVSRKSGRAPETIIAQMKGVAVYSPNLRRLFHIPVTGPTDGELSISFREVRNQGEGASARVSLARVR
jgi:hypothetical protein